jgi:hypothetical protein
MAKIVKRISKAVGFSKSNKNVVKNGFMNFVESFVDNVDPKNFSL